MILNLMIASFLVLCVLLSAFFFLAPWLLFVSLKFLARAKSVFSFCVASTTVLFCMVFVKYQIIVLLWLMN